MEVDKDFVHRQFRCDYNVVGIHRIGTGADAALAHNQVHHVPDVGIGQHQMRLDQRFFDAVDTGGVGQINRVVHFHHGAVFQIDVVNHAGIGGDNVHIVFPAQTLLNDFHVEQTEEAAAETETQRSGTFRLIDKSRVVELQFAHTEFKLVIIGAVNGVNTAEHHRAHFFEPGERLFAGHTRKSHRIADLGIRGAFDVGDQVAHFTGIQTVGGAHFGAEKAHFLDFAFQTGAEKFHPVAPAETARHHAHINHHPAVRVVSGVKNQRTGAAVAFFRRRDAVDHRFKKFRNPFAGLTGNEQSFFAGDRQNFFHLFIAEFKVRCGQVDLVDQRNDVQIFLERQIDVGNGLRLHALRGVDQKQRAFASAQRTAHFVVEVNVSGSVNKVDLISIAIIGFVIHAHRMGLDGNTAFAFQIHTVKKLILHFALRHRIGILQQAVGKGGFTVVDVRNDRKVTDMFQWYISQVCF